jgi:hypothetical protein
MGHDTQRADRSRDDKGWDAVLLPATTNRVSIHNKHKK